MAATGPFLIKYCCVEKDFQQPDSREGEVWHFFTNIMVDDNNNRLLALAPLELVRGHGDLRLIKLDSHIHDLTFELAINPN